MLEIFKSFSFLIITFVSAYGIYTIPSVDYINTNSFYYVNNGNNVEDIIVKKDIPIMHLSIPKLGVENDIYNKDSINNDIDKNVQIMKESDLPTNNFGNVILGGHSGTGRFAYFKNFASLDIGDEIIISYNSDKYRYIIKNIYNDDKDGKIIIRRDINKNTLTLFTCNPKNKGSYLVVIAELF